MRLPLSPCKSLKGALQTVSAQNPMTAKERLTIPPEEMEKLRRIATEVNAAAGIPATPSVTAEQLRERMAAKGKFRPEDRIFQRELMRMRYGHDEEEDK
jgi:DNA-binding transcriptional regulator/RsmH inhibitor MraZ